MNNKIKRGPEKTYLDLSAKKFVFGIIFFLLVCLFLLILISSEETQSSNGSSKPGNNVPIINTEKTPTVTLYPDSFFSKTLNKFPLFGLCHDV